jgi:hypothetical protein
MMKLGIVFAVCAMATCTFAGDLTLSAEGDGAGNVAISYTSTGDPPVGVSAVVNVSSGNATLGSGSSASGCFNINIDWFNSNIDEADPLGMGEPVGDADGPGSPGAGATSFAISTGSLDDQADCPSDGDIATIVLDCGDGESTLDISEDALRGGIVDNQGNAMNVTYPGPVAVCSGGGGCACKGDANGDGTVNTVDFQTLLIALGNAGPPYSIDPVPDNLVCADATGVGKLDTVDFQTLLIAVGVAGPPYDLNGCME